MLVMLMLAMSVVLGVTYMSIASVKVCSSDNYVGAARAKCLAESGLEHALYILQNKPSLLDASSAANPLGPYTIDGTGDSYVVWATLDAGTPGRYNLAAKGASGLLAQKSGARATRSPLPFIGSTRAMTITASSAWLPSTVTINGNIQVNGKLNNYGHVNGDASATSTISDPSRYITGAKLASAKAVPLPALTCNDYSSYKLFAQTYTTPTKTTNYLTSASSLTNGGAVKDDNPGGVIRFDPWGSNTLVINDNVNFTGTIVIDGDVILDGSNIQLTATQGFPAIIASGSIYVTGNTGATINGLVQANGGLVGLNSNSYSRTTINGAIISNNSSGYDYYLRGKHTLNFKADSSNVYDINGKNGGLYAISLEDYVR